MGNRRAGWQGVIVGLVGSLVFGAGIGGVAARAVQVKALPPVDYSGPEIGKDPVHDRLKEQQVLSAAQERHKRMVADSDKLLQLATELKEEVDKSTKNEMSVAAIKKAGDIEKLAHDVKERMRGE